jgi:hypothetical protein
MGDDGAYLGPSVLAFVLVVSGCAPPLPLIGRQVEKRQQRIEREVEDFGEHPWAGAYYFGDGLGVNVTLSIAPESGVAYTWRGCMGLYDANHGTIEYSDGILRLDWKYADDADRASWAGDALRYEVPELVVVPWGDEVFLVRPNDMEAFCGGTLKGYALRRVKEGRNRRSGSVPVGQPEVPEAFRSLLGERSSSDVKAAEDADK